LPMICRRGGIDKHDIGAIRILDTTTEFEISERAAESFAVKVQRPDKEDNIRIEPLGDDPQAQPSSENRAPAPKHGKPHRESGPRFDGDASSRKKRHQDKPARAGQAQPAGAPFAKPAFGKKPKKNRRG
jgi:ATP-dependent RNA helicase DeaD